MALRPCIDCGTPTTTTRCRGCQAPLSRAKWLNNPNRDLNYRKLRAAYARALPLPCAICQEPITHQGHDRDALTLDHVRPWADGGSNDPSNLRPTHKRCNSARGRRDGGTP
ncbi:MAG: HNH endonuclease signature motif containing protein [Acidimicrobiia bacterium]